MARKTLSTDSEIQYDGGAETFLARQGETVRHWAAPKIENARAWGEAGAAFGEVGGAYAAEEGRRVAKDAKSEYLPKVKERADRATQTVAGRYESVAPAVTAGLAAVAPLLQKQSGTVQGFVSSLQDQAAQKAEELQKNAARARKDAEKRAKKTRKTAGRKASAARRDGRRLVKKADRKTDALGFLAADKAEKAKGSVVQGGMTAAGLLAAAVAALQDQGQKMAPQVQERVAEASRYADRRREEFAPVAAARLADVAGSARKTAHDVTVPTSIEQALIALTGDKKVVKKTRKSAERFAAAKEKELKRTARGSDRSGGRGWIVAGMATAAAGAGLAVWKLTKPVQDPWAAPVPGPITANIPVVQADGARDPFAMQRKAVAEATGGRETFSTPTAPAVNHNPAVADANVRLLGESPRA